MPHVQLSEEGAVRRPHAMPGWRLGRVRTHAVTAGNPTSRLGVAACTVLPRNAKRKSFDESREDPRIPLLVYVPYPGPKAPNFAAKRPDGSGVHG